MAVYTRSLTVAHRAGDLFELVSDVRRYPDFIKWVKALRVSQERQEGEVRHCLAEAVIVFKGFTERFSTHVSADPAAHAVKVDLASGPFHHLRNNWSITGLPNGKSEVEFHIDYEFRGFFLRTFAAANTEMAVRRIMDAFLDEAARRYERIR